MNTRNEEVEKLLEQLNITKDTQVLVERGLDLGSSLGPVELKDYRGLLLQLA